MKISIVAVGKIKEKFIEQAVQEYAKRMSKFCDFKIIEVEDESLNNAKSAELEMQAKRKEAERILKKIPDNAYVISMEILGKKLTSPQLAEKIEQIMVMGRSHIVIVIGGSLGLDKSVSERADFKLSMSDMTFPHQLARVLIVEQVYRAFKINNNETYHK